MQKADAPQFSLRQMVEISGLSEFTLRGWETRYEAFAPRRTGTGRRVYGSADLTKALALRSLTEQGLKISEIAHLSIKQLEKKLLAQAATPPAPAAGEKIAKLLALVETHRWPELEESLEYFRASQHPLPFIEEVALPLMQQLSARVLLGRISVGQEHVVSALLKEKLYLASTQGNPNSRSTFRAVLTTPAGDMHEIGLLVAYALARHSGVAALYLGPNTPKKELCEAALRFSATHVILSSTVSKTEGASEDLYSYVNYLDRHLPPQTEVWIGGRAAQNFDARLGRPLKIFSSLGALRAALPQTYVAVKQKRARP